MSVQTHIVECNRANSVIDSSENNLGRWTTGCNLELLPGDRVNVEACVVNSTGASSGGSTMEFTSENVVVQGEEKNYCDNHVVFEFGFYINNNQSSSIQLPIRQNMRYWAGDPELGPDILNSTRTGDGTSADKYVYIQDPDVGWGSATANTPGTATEAGGTDGTLPVPLTINQADLAGSVGTFPGRGLGFGFGVTEQFGYVRVFNRTTPAVANAIVVGDKYNFIAVASWTNTVYPGMPGGGTYLGCNCGPDILTTPYTFPPPVLQNPIPNGTCVQYWNFPLRPGMEVFIGSTVIGTGESLGIIKKLWIGTDPALKDAMAFPAWTNALYNTRLVIEFEEDFELNNPYGMHQPLRGKVLIGNDPSNGTYDNRGRMGYGLINPSSQPKCYADQGIGGYWHTENVTTYPAATGATIDYCRQRALAGMMLWERGRHYFSEWDYRNVGGSSGNEPYGGIQYLEGITSAAPLVNSSPYPQQVSGIIMTSFFNFTPGGGGYVAPVFLPAGQPAISFEDSGSSANYSSSENRAVTLHAGSNAHFEISITSLEFESGTTSFYDRLGLTAASSVADLTLATSALNLTSAPLLSDYLVETAVTNPETVWGTSYTNPHSGGGGWVFNSTDADFVTNGGTIGQFYPINTEYIRFYFQSDTSVTKPGWQIAIRSVLNTPPLSTSAPIYKYNKMTPQWRSFGCSQPVLIDKLGSNPLDLEWPYGGMKNSALGPSQWMSTNLRDNKDNAPYILVAPTYQGPQVLPDGTALAPEIRKLTCFVSVKITDSFTSALDVAKQFTDAFHQANPFLKRSQIVQKNTDRPAKVNTIKPVYKAVPFINPNKSQRVATKSTNSTTAGGSLIAGTTRDGIPLVPTNAYIENASGPCNLTLNRRALYDVVAPVYTGNLVKCIPCNLIPGINWEKQATAPYNYVPNDEDDYHFSGVSGKAWCNLIYGGMAVKDFQKWSSGDLLCRLKCWNGDVAGKSRQFPRAVILNSQLQNETVRIANPVYVPTIPYSTEEGTITGWGQPLPITPNVTTGTEWTGFPTYKEAPPLGAPFTVPPFANTGWDFTAPCDYFKQTTTIPFTGTILNKYQYLFTSIEYTDENLDMLQRAMRNNEKYTATSGRENVTIDSQNVNPENWFYEYDIGMANDEVGMNLRPEVCRTESADELFNYYSYPMLGNFDDDHSENCMLNGMARYYVRGSKINSNVVAASATYNYRKLNKDSEWVDGVLTGEWCAPGMLPASVQGGDYPSRLFTKSVISPAQSYKGQGWETKYQSARGCGIVQCFSRWCGFTAPTPQNAWYELEGTGPGTCAVFSQNQYLVDPTPSVTRNINVTPYIYTDDDGNKHTLCAFQTFRSYDPRRGTSNALSTTEPTSTQNWELAVIQWGDLFGFSPSLLDNPAILPMNNDIPATQAKDAYVQGIDSWDSTVSPPTDLPNYTDVGTKMTSQEEPFNKVNFTWIGSINAGVNFNGQTNRFEISGFNSPHVLSSLDQPAPPPSTSGGGGTAQGAAQQGYENLAGVGSNIATYGNDVVTSYFASDLEKYNKSDKFYAENIDVFSSADGNYMESGGQYNIRNDRYNDDTNQGKADSQTGVFIENVFLAPANWVPPTLPYGGDLQNYWVPGTENLNATEEQRELIVKDLIKADKDNFNGSLLHKMGFTLEQLIPTYGSQDGDFNPLTNGSTNPVDMYAGTKPLILNTLSDVASNQITNLYSAPFDANAYAAASGTTAAVTGYPFANLDPKDYVGLPQFHQGSVNGLAVNVSNSIPGTLVAKNLPSLYASAYYLVISDIVPTQFQSDQNGNVGSSNAIFYAMKNYGAGDFYYSSGSDYWQVVTKRRLVTSITTEIRSPTTGKLATLGPNSVVLYKIQRTFNLPDPQQILMEASELEKKQMEEYEKEMRRQKNNMNQ